METTRNRSQYMTTAPRWKHHNEAHTFLGQVGIYDVYQAISDAGDRELVARRHTHPDVFRLVPFAYAVVFAGRGNDFWRSAVALADATVANDNLPNPHDMVVVRTHLRRRPGMAS